MSYFSFYVDPHPVLPVIREQDIFQRLRTLSVLPRMTTSEENMKVTTCMLGNDNLDPVKALLLLKVEE